MILVDSSLNFQLKLSFIDAMIKGINYFVIIEHAEKIDNMCKIKII